MSFSVPPIFEEENADGINKSDPKLSLFPRVVLHRLDEAQES